MDSSADAAPLTQRLKLQNGGNAAQNRWDQ